MLSIRSLNTRILLVICLTLLFSTLISSLAIGHIQKRLIDRDQDRFYQLSLDWIVDQLKVAQSELESLGIAEAYRDEFQERFLADFHEKYLSDESLKSNLSVYPFIIDRTYRVVAHPFLDRNTDLLIEAGLDNEVNFIEEMVRLQNGSLDYNFRGAKKWMCFKAFEPWGWMIAYSVPYEVKYASARQMRMILFTTLSIATLIAMLVASWIVSGFIRPVGQLTETARQIRDGDNEILARVNSQDEVGELADAFNNMTRKLRNSIQEVNAVNTILKENQALLEQEISERMQAEQESLNARDAAQAANAAKSDFLANMSHEIRTPMNGVMGMAELLLNTELSEQQIKYTETIQKSALDLLAIINDILDFSKIEAGRLILDDRPFDLGLIVDDVAGMVAVQARKKNIEVVVDYAPQLSRWFRGDGSRLRQVMMNIVGNAIKFTCHGHVLIQVEVGNESTQSARIVIRIEDTGIGIAAEKIDHIFEKFSQGDNSTTRKFGGTGLGLAVTRGLVELMGGAIRVESQVNVGSVFWIELTLPPTEPQETVTAPLDDLADFEGMNVLVVDDREPNRHILKEILESWNFIPHLADGGGKALDMLEQARDRQQPFDLIILDGMMPDMDGFQVAEKIRQSDGDAYNRLLMLTSSDFGNESTLCRDLNMAYLFKPVRQHELAHAILRVMRKQGETTGDSPGQDLTAAQPGKPVASHGLKLLLVEDNLINQEVAVGILELMGHQVVVAQDGVEGVSCYQKDKYDLIFMDIQMPVMSGIEATDQIRQIDAAEQTHIPIVAMTANALKGDRERFLAAGMDDYISKPIQPDEIARVLQRFFPDVFESGSAGQSQDNPPHPFPVKSSNESDIIELDSLKKRCMNKEDVLLRILKMFARKMPQVVEELNSLLQKDLLEEAWRQAHAIKGAAANISAPSLSAIAAEVEQRARIGAREHACSSLLQLKLEMKRCLNQIERIVSDAQSLQN